MNTRRNLRKRKTIFRDISWLSFNARVLQEAADDSVPLRERIKFLGIFSNNLDEFFRVRVATLNRMIEFGKRSNMHLEESPNAILEQIQEIVLEQQKEFDRIWNEILRELKKEKIFLVNDMQLNRAQQKFVLDYFNEEIRGNIIPLMIESIQNFPVLSDKSIYLACKLSRKDKSVPQKFALVSVPARRLPRFTILPSRSNEKHIILLEDMIRFCLPVFKHQVKVHPGIIELFFTKAKMKTRRLSRENGFFQPDRCFRSLFIRIYGSMEILLFHPSFIDSILKSMGIIGFCKFFLHVLSPFCKTA